MTFFILFETVLTLPNCLSRIDWEILINSTSGHKFVHTTKIVRRLCSKLWPAVRDEPTGGRHRFGESVLQSSEIHNRLRRRRYANNVSETMPP